MLYSSPPELTQPFTKHEPFRERALLHSQQKFVFRAFDFFYTYTSIHKHYSTSVRKFFNEKMLSNQQMANKASRDNSHLQFFFCMVVDEFLAYMSLTMHKKMEAMLLLPACKAMLA
jgi:hypothetical protein